MSTADHCNFCQKYFGKTNLRQCSRCKFVRYCSKECQRGAWPTHKRACVQGAELRRAAEANPELEELTDTVSKWLACWRGTLFKYGMMAMDLANHPHDRLATHVIFIELELREPRPRDRSRLLKMLGGKVMTRDECADVLRYLELDEAHVQDWKEDCRGDHTIQITMACESHTRTIWVSFRDLSRYRGMPKAMSASVAMAWEDFLIEKIDNGEPDPIA